MNASASTPDWKKAKQSSLKKLRKLYGQMKAKIRKLKRVRNQSKSQNKMTYMIKNLKQQRKEVKEMFYAVTLAKENDWSRIKPKAKIVFREAKELLVRVDKH